MTKLVTPELAAGRILTSGGKITSLPFSVQNGNIPFSIFIIPISSGATADDKTTIVNCTCYNNTTPYDTPFTTNCWDVPLLKEISENGVDLNNFDIYWGNGL